jgi:hypothetical protein
MNDRRVLIYFAWSTPAEAAAPLTVIDDRFPAIFELRRLFYPTYEALADPRSVDQGIAGFLEHVQRPNFVAFAEHAEMQTGHPAIQVERITNAGVAAPLDDALIEDVDTVIVISFDSLRTGQVASRSEIGAVQRFLANADHLIAICPHHDIGETTHATPQERMARQLAEHLHHGDKASPPRQGFGGFARSLLAGLGVPVENRFGLRPACLADGSPEPVEVEKSLDRLRLLEEVGTFNSHPHLPHLERCEPSISRLDVLARQRIDLTAPPHPFTQNGRATFDALLQSKPETFAGTLLVCDTTLWSSTAGGLDSLRRFWSNVVGRRKDPDSQRGQP